MEWKEAYLDLLLVPLGLGILLAYHVFYYLKVKKHPLQTVVGMNHLGRTAWVHSIMQDNEKKNVLAVQTLRNSIMASTLMASTAILMSSAVAALLSSSYSIKKPLQEVLYGNGRHQQLVSARFIALLVCFLFSFICYMQSIRFINHVGYLINIPMNYNNTIITPEYVARVLARGCNFYTIGTRGYYLAFALLLWIFSPIALFVACSLLVPFLHWLDMVSDNHHLLLSK